MKPFLTAALTLLLACTAALAQRAVPINPARPILVPADRLPTVRGPDLARGVNFGNMLEGPFEGAWGLTVEERFFDAAVDAGMDHIRLPVSWTHHAADTAPYTIDPAFMDRVAWCVDQALARGLTIIVNVHHYDELNADPVAEAPRFLAIWQQVAARFADRPRTVLFEVLNEPHGAFNDDPALWDATLADALAVIRQTNPRRWVLAGPVRWNAIAALDTFNPPADRRLIVAVHNYEPFAFTHQGASWVGTPPPVGTVWTGDAYGLSDLFQNWSWNTTVTPADTGLTVQHNAGYAGLYLRRSSAADNVSAVTFEIDAARTLNVIVGVDGSDQARTIETMPGVNTVTFDPPVPAATNIMLQNATPNGTAPFTLAAVRVTHAGGVDEAIVTEAQAVDLLVRRAAEYARARGLPVHLGEFGAYSPADMDSRARWTRAVREAAERHGVAWAYWELAAGFGFFDPGAGVFRQPLLDALTD